MSDQERLLFEVEAFLRERDMTPSAFGLAAVHDAKFVGRLRDRRDMRVSTIQRVRQFMASHARHEAA